MSEFDLFEKALNASVSFPVEINLDCYPDIGFDIKFDTQPDEATITQCVSALVDYVYRYNRTHLIRPIHYVSELGWLPDPPSPFFVSIHIDFGYANPMSALRGALKALEKTKLPISKLYLE